MTLVSTEYPCRSRGAAATHLHGISRCVAATRLWKIRAVKARQEAAVLGMDARVAVGDADAAFDDAPQRRSRDVGDHYII